MERDLLAPSAVKRPVTREPLAHITPEGEPHLLEHHLEEVARIAGSFAPSEDMAAWARLAGLWHDLGKYSPDFQHRIRSENGFEAHVVSEAEGERDHSSAGALWARERLGEMGMLVAFAIAGHHAGLADLADLQSRLRRKAERLDSARRCAPEALLHAPRPPTPAWLAALGRGEKARLDLWTRMLFSALCDADFLDTEAFYDVSRARQRAGYPTLDALRLRLTAHLDQLSRDAPATEVNRVRSEVLGACRAGGSLVPGVFSLTVPTGGGKTLSSLAFALEHARAHGMARVIVAIPYTSIIEQTAGVYAEALGKDAVLEHHSALDPLRETARSRLAAENWDAPVIVTTTVQLLESLFANRPSRCRKLHNVARSVIILDEAQTLPPGLLNPVLDGLTTLVQDYGCSLVLCTATQPALGRTPLLPQGLPEVRELVPRSLRAFERLRRVKVRWPEGTEPTPYSELAAEVAAAPDVLAIVHLRNDARRLCELLDARLGHADTLHLSALMCAEHRFRVLGAIRALKREGRPVRLVATQLVEAGVDLDFPLVYRSLGGLDALAQAAGRCNREGRLPSLGELRVYEAETQPPQGVPRTAREITRGLLAQFPDLDLFDPGVCRTYFERLYLPANRDQHHIQELRGNLAFQSVASQFKLVEDGWSAPLVVPYGHAAARLEEARALGPSRERLRALQRFTINVPVRWRDEWLARGTAELVADAVVALRPEFARAAYDERFGLLPERVGIADAAALVIG